MDEKSKPAKMAEKEEKMKEKQAKLDAKLKGITKTATTATALIAMVLFAGCLDTQPASRSNDASYGDFKPSVVINGSSNTVTVITTVGDGVYATADGGGDTQDTTPTMDVKPDIKAAVGAGATASGAAGNNPDMLTSIVNTVYGWLGANKGVTLTADEKTKVAAAAAAACAGGNCSLQPGQ